VGGIQQIEVKEYLLLVRLGAISAPHTNNTSFEDLQQLSCWCDVPYLKLYEIRTPTA